MVNFKCRAVLKNIVRTGQYPFLMRAIFETQEPVACTQILSLIDLTDKLKLGEPYIIQVSDINRENDLAEYIMINTCIAVDTHHNVTTIQTQFCRFEFPTAADDYNKLVHKNLFIYVLNGTQ